MSKTGFQDFSQWIELRSGETRAQAITLVPARIVPELVEQCIAKGVRSLHLFTAGFSETGDPQMAGVERDAVRRLRAAGIRTIGPNCLGLYVPASGLTFGEFPMETGNVMLISQSGANAGEVIGGLARRGIRFSKAVSYGNAADVSAEELFEEPIVIGLTATPPDRSGRAPEDILRYDEFFGPVDFEVPVPAVVKDGYLAPYQDLAWNRAGPK